jgi:O-antigen/teichoic acid export membrane protein
MATRVLSLPLAVFAMSAGQVFVSQLGHDIRERGGAATAIFRRTSRTSALAAAAFGIAIGVAGPWGFALLLGPQWEISGDYARVLMIGVAAQLIAVPVAQTMILMDRKLVLLLVDCMRLSGVTAAFVCGYRLGWGLTSTLLLASSLMALSYSISWVQSRTLIRKLASGQVSQDAPRDGSSLSSSAAQGQQ